MLFFKNKSLVIVIMLFAYSAYGDSLDYKDRGDRWEGIKPQPVSGRDIELLSATADYDEKWQPIPAYCKVKFYLQQATKVDIDVQEVRPKHFYKLDQVVPNWKSGFNNFMWRTSDVIAPLNLKITSLGIVARLAIKDEKEYVAPVIFYHNNPPAAINGYLFVLKVGGNAKLKYVIYQGNKVVTEESLDKQFVGEPFVIYWDSKNSQAGTYELIVDGYFLDNNDPIYKVISFYHQPKIK
ncbi:hypothetical protein QUF74_04070 [Candidatus Halobeggiatoa sp. HSG11]|nr:hypothetical protein [Candidatus Halobeggiatoa sp. HSG11]